MWSDTGTKAVNQQTKDCNVNSTKKTWQTPSIEIFGTMREKTEQEPPNAKLVGSFDGDPFEDCPPGQFEMGGCNGAGGVS
jgi:hypothetical protein